MWLLEDRHHERLRLMREPQMQSYADSKLYEWYQVSVGRPEPLSVALRYS